MYFPAQFTNPLSQSYWRQQKERLVKQLTAIIDGEDYSEDIGRIDANMRRNMRVKSFMGNDNEELKYEKDFEMNCIVLAVYSNKPVKECTVMEYFTLMKYHDIRQKK